MSNKQIMKFFLPITLVFIILNGLIITFKTFLESKGFDRDFLIITSKGNSQTSKGDLNLSQLSAFIPMKSEAPIATKN